MDADAFAAVIRSERGRVLATLLRRCGDLDLAEDATGEAELEAWESWPVDGVPDNPGAWLTTVARRRLIDRLRREAQRAGRESAAVERDARTTATPADPSVVVEDADTVADDELALLVMCCHPALSIDAQIALTLRVASGLTTAEISTAFGVPEPTMAQRIVRAKRKIALAGIPFRRPLPSELGDRIGAVLHVVYLVFNEGYAASGTDTVVRADLCREAIRLARSVVRLVPHDDEAIALLALLLLLDSRRAARVDAFGRLVPLDDQDRGLWDASAVAEGVALVERALSRGPLGPYEVQAAIAAVHAEARSAATTDWRQVLGLYDLLVRLDPGPGALLGRVVALAEARGAQAGLTEADRIGVDPVLARGHRLRSVRAHLLERVGRTEEAEAEFRAAAALAPTEPERRYLLDRASSVTGRPPSADVTE